jgi:hypothetical protein
MKSTGSEEDLELDKLETREWLDYLDFVIYRLVLATQPLVTAKQTVLIELHSLVQSERTQMHAVLFRTGDGLKGGAIRLSRDGAESDLHSAFDDPGCALLATRDHLFDLAQADELAQPRTAVAR